MLLISYLIPSTMVQMVQNEIPKSKRKKGHLLRISKYMGNS